MPFVRITVDPLLNAILVDQGGIQREARLGRRWAAHFLAQLVARHRKNEPLALACLQAELQRLGQPQALNRAQIQRIIKAIEAAFVDLGSRAPKLAYTPGDQCGGPWRLSSPEGTQWDIRHRQQEGVVQPPLRRGQWHSPLLCKDPALADLHQLMCTLMVADDLHRHSDFQAAHEELQDAYEAALTPEGLQLVLLKDAYALKHHGEYGPARQCCQRIIQVGDTSHKAPGMASLAKFMLDRIRYDENPAVAYESLRHTAQPPEHLHAPDRTALAEWHNLQALLARRHMQAAPHEAEQAHGLALAHFESALYLRMAAQDAGKVPDVLFNLAFHLQKAHSLGLCSLLEVCQWYGMAAHYDHRHNLMGSSCWDYLFMGKLWLENHQELQSLMRQSVQIQGELNNALLLDHHHPWQGEFFIEAVRRSLLTGDVRQQAIAHILAQRFARLWHHPGLSAKVHERDLQALLHAHPALSQQLLDDGYGDSQAQAGAVATGAS
jgi:tetratricopeptide (TPR) repeat protein